MAEVGAEQLPEGKIGVVVSADEQYAIPLTIMFISLLKNTIDPSKVRLFCIDGGITSSTRKAMELDIAGLGSELRFIKIDKEQYDNFKATKRITSAAYYRISIPEIFSKNVSKMIYLDCDIIIKGDIEELWDTDIDKYHLAAVENIARSTHRKSGVKQSDYFNSGVLVINLDKWRTDGISEKVRRFLAEDREKAENDQDALNCVLFNSWKHLPLKWNHQTGLYRKSKQFDLFSPQEVEEAILVPSAIHYVGWDKPWHAICLHPLASEYDRYANQASFVSAARKKPSLIEKILVFSRISNLKRLWRTKRLQSWYKENGYDFYHSHYRTHPEN